MEDSVAEWPAVFDALKAVLNSSDPDITIAESFTRHAGADRCTRFLTCGLIDEHAYEAITGEDDIGQRVEPNGPFPHPRDAAFTPRFRIFLRHASGDGIEPLVPAWTNSTSTVHQPDLGLLMTYGLVPRVVDSRTVHWDEPSKREFDVLVVDAVSTFKHGDDSASFVRMKRDYVQDYASLRKLAVVCVFQEICFVTDGKDAESILGGESEREWHYQDARVRVKRIHGAKTEYMFEVSGHRLLMRPGALPISDHANRYGTLTWPGLSQPVTDDNWRGQGLKYVYIKDDVLDRFESNADYEVQPEHGFVSYGEQWGISHCDRVARDLIRVEVKKLYEGTPPEIVRHYHQHAVSPPTQSTQEMRSVRNIGVRARDVVLALADLGDAIAPIASHVFRKRVVGREVVSLDRPSLDYHGWWKGPSVEPICRHVPKSATEGDFLDRCTHLDQLIAEGLKESLLRDTLIALGTDPTGISKLRSIKLLAHLIELCRISTDSGLSLIAERTEVLSRWTTPASPSPCEHMLALNSLRQLKAHRSGSTPRDKMTAGLRTFGIDPASTKPGYGFAIDALYDSLAKELRECADSVQQIV